MLREIERKRQELEEEEVRLAIQKKRDLEELERKRSELEQRQAQEEEQ